MNRQLRVASLVLVLGLLLGIGYGQQQGWAAGQTGQGLKQAGNKLKQLFSPAAARKASGLAPRPALALTPAAPLATITVTSLGDGVGVPANCPGANCRLNDAIAKAVPGDTINFAVNGTIVLNSSLNIDKSLNIQGPGAALLTISGRQLFRVCYVTSGNTVALSGLTIANGKSTSGGAGIINDGTLTITNSTLTGNVAQNATGGGIENRGSLTLSNCLIFGNSGMAGGGGIENGGSLMVSNSTISGNSVALGSGGGINNFGSLTITDSTISDNTANASSSGGGLNNASGSSATITGSTLSGNSAIIGGGIFSRGTLIVTNSTLTGNSADNGGGLRNENGTATLTNCTLFNNTAPFGGGIYSQAGTVNARNTLIAGNSASSQGPDIYGTINSQGHNLIGNTANATITGVTTGNRLNVNPLLAPLANYGGPTDTHALLPGSPAINAGHNCVTQTPGCLATPLSTEQRGAGFNRQVGGSVDIGALESQGFTLAIASGNNQSTTAYTAFDDPLAVTVTANGVGEPVDGGQVTFTPPAGGASATLAGNPVTISSSAASSGIVTANGVAGSYSVQAGSPGFTPVSFSLTNLTFNCPSFTVGTPANGAYGQSYSSSVAAAPAAPAGFSYRYTLANGTTLPAGLTLNTNTGAITGTPTASGTISFAIRAELYGSNAATGCAVTQTRSITIACAAVVTNNNDSGAGSLRDTLATACPGGTITFANGISLITLTSGELVINRNLTINGPGAAQLRISGNQASRVFLINSGVTVTLSGLTIANGISNFGAGVRNEGTVTITNSVLTGNAASGGGGIYNYLGTATITNSTLSGNASSQQGGGGINNFNGTLIVTGSTLSGNAANGGGTGGGIQNNGSLTLTNSTLSGNSATNGGGLRNDGTATITNSTFSGNSATAGGGIYSLAGTVNAKNTLIAGNTASSLGPDFYGTLSSQGYNLIGNTDDTTITDITTGNLLNVAPLLGPLANYGGATQTYALLPGSPAINAGTSAGAPTTDQRGVARPQQNAVDIGAFESRGFTLAIASGNNQSTLSGSAFANPLAVTVTANGAGEPVNGGRVTFTPPAGGASATVAGNPATISSSAATSGTVMANAVAGSYTVQAGGPGFTSVSFSLTNGSCPTITVTNPNTSTGAVGTPFNQSFTRTGGVGTVTFSLNSGTLPNGLTLNSSGVLSGTPTQGGTFPITVKATDNNNCSGTGATYNLVISCPTITVTNPNTSTGMVGTSFNQSFTRTGGVGTVTFSLNSGTLPNGLTLNSSGVLSGTPTQGGTFPITVKATDSNNCSGTGATYNLVINCPSFTVGTPAAGAYGQSYSSSVAATPAAPAGSSYQYTLANSTALPAGLTLDFNTGAITGTPTAQGLVSFDIQVRFINGGTPTNCTVTQTRSINITCSSVVVMNSNDSGAGSLSEALDLVCPGGTITFANGISSIRLLGAQLNKNLTMNGPGATQLTISGDQLAPVFIINSGVSVVLNGLTIANGRNNVGGGIINDGTLTITNSALSGNAANNDGGAIFNNGTLSIINSTLSGNSVTHANGAGGGLSNSSNGAATITNSTLSGNSAAYGGGIMSGGTLTLINCTLTGNSASQGGGGIIGVVGGGTVSARNTLIAGNTAPFGPDVNGPLSSQGYNLIGNTSGADITGASTGNLLNVNPLLGALANNGGPTKTHALLAGSPAINAGNNCVTQTPGCLATPLTTDQRGAGFNRQVGSAVDIGAFELAGSNTAPAFTPAAALSRQQGSLAGAAVTVGTVSDAQTAAGSLIVTLTGGTAIGITVTGITNTNGTITALLSAACTATAGTVRFQVSDGSLTGTGDLQVNLTANAAPAVGSYPNTTIAPGGSTIVTPSAAPADNGSIASVTATATPNFFTGTLTVNTATGAVTITNANPTGGYTITVTLTDNCGATTVRTFMLTVGACGASLSKTGQNFAASGGTGNFTVTIDGACAWTAVSNNPSFITVVSPQGQQAGSGTVSFSVAGHSNNTPRSGTITVAGQTFIVRQGAQFSDVPVGTAFYEEIGKLSAVGVTQGCGGGNYCPGSNVTREQMAAFIIRALGDFNPPPPATQRFGDVPSSNPFYAHIEQMAVRQVTLGCGGGNYCPTANVTRDQMAAFLIRALHAPGYVPPAPSSQRFADVLPSSPFYAHIEELAVRAITLGCGGGNYCPTANVTRGQMAAFLVRAFGL